MNETRLDKVSHGVWTSNWSQIIDRLSLSKGFEATVVPNQLLRREEPSDLSIGSQRHDVDVAAVRVVGKRSPDLSRES